MKSKMKIKKSINLLLDADLMKRLDVIADWESSNRTALIRRAIDLYVSKAEVRRANELSANTESSD